MNKEKILPEFNLNDYTNNPYELSIIQRVIDYCEQRTAIQKWAVERQYDRYTIQADDNKGRILVCKSINKFHADFITKTLNEKSSIFLLSEPTEFIYNVTAYFFDRGACGFRIKKEVYDYLHDKYFNIESKTKEQEPLNLKWYHKICIFIGALIIGIIFIFQIEPVTKKRREYAKRLRCFNPIIKKNIFGFERTEWIGRDKPLTDEELNDLLKSQ